jgi:hypothetical protein
VIKRQLGTIGKAFEAGDFETLQPHNVLFLPWARQIKSRFRAGDEPPPGSGWERFDAV